MEEIIRFTRDGQSTNNPAEDLMNMAPVDFEKCVDSMSYRSLTDARLLLEAVAERAAFIAEYLAGRQGYFDGRLGDGYGDQGHKQAVRSANRAAKIVRMNAFGYNGFHAMCF